MRSFFLLFFLIFSYGSTDAENLKPSRGIIATSNPYASEAAYEIIKRAVMRLMHLLPFS